MSRSDWRASLASVREPGAGHWAAIALSGVVGLALATVHWLGLAIGGALVALPAPSVRRGLLAGLAFGLLAWLVFAGRLWWLGSLDAAAALGPLWPLAAGSALGLAVLGSLVRALV